MVHELDSEEIKNNLQTKLVTEEYPDIEGQLLAVGRSKLFDRRVDYFIRIFNGKLQERQDFYEGDQLFHSGDWRQYDELFLSGGQVKFPGEGHGTEGKDPISWAEAYVEDWLWEYTTEIWSEERVHRDENTN
jgi:hypothetical protein